MGYIRAVGMYELPTGLVGYWVVELHTHLIGRLLCSVREFWCVGVCWSLVGSGVNSFGVL